MQQDIEADVKEFDIYSTTDGGGSEWVGEWQQEGQNSVSELLSEWVNKDVTEWICRWWSKLKEDKKK